MVIMTTVKAGWPSRGRSTRRSVRHAEQHHDDDGQQEGEPERQAGDGHRGQADEAAHHHQIALGEIDGFGRLVDQHEAERDQRVDAADRRSADGQLQELQHPGFSSGGKAVLTAFRSAGIMHQAE
jgi:hypothetical protein